MELGLGTSFSQISASEISAVPWRYSILDARDVEVGKSGGIFEAQKREKDEEVAGHAIFIYFSMDWAMFFLVFFFWWG